MKHSVKVTIILLIMFFIAQLIGLVVSHIYAPQTIQVVDEKGNLVNITTNDLPSGFETPQGMDPYSVLLSIIFPLALAITVMYLLMKFKIETFLRLWFFAVIVLALYITFYAFLKNVILNTTVLYILIIVLGVILAYIKVFKKNLIIHNFTELLIYPGIAAIFTSLIAFNDSSLSSSAIFGPLYRLVGISAATWSIITCIIILILISLYDMYAVWQAGFMQKMAKYQIKTLKIFSGFFIPYLGKKERELIRSSKKSKSSKNKNVKVNIAILGGGDIVFPMILSGIVLNTLGLFSAILVTIGATASLGYLFYISEKGKFYPAMPFISIGCFVGLIISYFI